MDEEAFKEGAVNFFTLLHRWVQAKQTDVDFTRIENKKLLLKPSAASAFPAADVKDIQADDDSVSIICQFMGLYGVDSPLPFYFNEQCLQEKPLANALKAFLDIFNHRSYVMYFLSWYAMQPEFNDEYGSSGYQDLIKNFAGPEAYSVDSCRGDFHQAWQEVFRDIPLIMEECIPAWEKLDSFHPLGCGWILNDTSIVGKRIYNRSHWFRLVLGPVSWRLAEKFLPGGELSPKLIDLVTAYNYLGIQFKVCLKVVSSSTVSAKLGASALGYSTRLGTNLSENSTRIQEQLIILNPHFGIGAER